MVWNTQAEPPDWAPGWEDINPEDVGTALWDYAGGENPRFTEERYSYMPRTIEVDTPIWETAGIDFFDHDEVERVSELFNRRIRPRLFENFVEHLPKGDEVYVVHDEPISVKRIAGLTRRSPEMLAYTMNLRNPDLTFDVDYVFQPGTHVPLYGKETGERMLSLVSYDALEQEGYSLSLPAGTTITRADGQNIGTGHPSVRADNFWLPYTLTQNKTPVAPTETADTIQEIEDAWYDPMGKIARRPGETYEDAVNRVFQETGGGREDLIVRGTYHALPVQRPVFVKEFAALTGMSLPRVMEETGLDDPWDVIPAGSMVALWDMDSDGRPARRAHPKVPTVLGELDKRTVNRQTGEEIGDRPANPWTVTPTGKPKKKEKLATISGPGTEENLAEKQAQGRDIYQLLEDAHRPPASQQEHPLYGQSSRTRRLTRPAPAPDPYVGRSQAATSPTKYSATNNPIPTNSPTGPDPEAPPGPKYTASSNPIPQAQETRRTWKPVDRGDGVPVMEQFELTRDAYGVVTEKQLTSNGWFQMREVEQRAEGSAQPTGGGTPAVSGYTGEPVRNYTRPEPSSDELLLIKPLRRTVTRTAPTGQPIQVTEFKVKVNGQDIWVDQKTALPILRAQEQEDLARNIPTGGGTPAVTTSPVDDAIRQVIADATITPGTVDTGVAPNPEGSSPGMTASPVNQNAQDAATAPNTKPSSGGSGTGGGSDATASSGSDTKPEPAPQTWVGGMWWEMVGGGKSTWLRVYRIPGSETLGTPDGGPKNSKFGYRYSVFVATDDEMAALFPDTDGVPANSKGQIDESEYDELTSRRIFLHGGNVSETIQSTENETFTDVFSDLTKDRYQAVRGHGDLGAGEMTVNDETELRISVLEGIENNWSWEETVNMSLSKTGWWGKRFPHIDTYTTATTPSDQLNQYLTLEDQIGDAWKDATGVEPSTVQIQEVIGLGIDIDDITNFASAFRRLKDPQMQSYFDSFKRILWATDPDLARQVGDLSTLSQQMAFVTGMYPHDVYRFWDQVSFDQSVLGQGLGHIFNANDVVDLQRRLTDSGIEITPQVFQRLQGSVNTVLRNRRALDLSSYDLDEQDLIDVSLGLTPSSGADPFTIERSLGRVEKENRELFGGERAAPGTQFDTEGNQQAVTLAKQKTNV